MEKIKLNIKTKTNQLFQKNFWPQKLFLNTSKSGSTVNVLHDNKKAP